VLKLFKAMPTKVFVGNLPDECAQETIRDVFGSYGGIDEVAIVKNFAFVHFSNEGDANNAVRDLDGSKIGGKQINVEISKKQDGARGRRDRDRDRDRNERNDRGVQRRGRAPERSNNAGGILGAGPLSGGNGVGAPPSIGGLPAAQLAGLAGPPLGGLGVTPLGGLGSGPLGALSGGPAGAASGILSAISTFAAVAEKQQQLNSSQQQHMQQQLPFQERRTERDQPDPDVRVRREVVPTRDVPNASAMGLTNGYVIYERYYVDPTHPLLKGLPLPELPRMSDNLASSVRNENRRDNLDAYRDRSPVHNGRHDRERDFRDVNDYRR